MHNPQSCAPRTGRWLRPWPGRRHTERTRTVRSGDWSKSSRHDLYVPTLPANPPWVTPNRRPTSSQAGMATWRPRSGLARCNTPRLRQPNSRSRRRLVPALSQPPPTLTPAIAWEGFAGVQAAILRGGARFGQGRDRGHVARPRGRPPAAQAHACLRQGPMIRRLMALLYSHSYVQ